MYSVPCECEKHQDFEILKLKNTKVTPKKRDLEKLTLCEKSKTIKKK